MQPRRLLKYDGMRQKTLNGHWMFKHLHKTIWKRPDNAWAAASFIVAVATIRLSYLQFFLSISTQTLSTSSVMAQLSNMRAILFALIYLLTLRFRKRNSLELEIIALRHQLGVLKRRRRHPPLIIPADRALWSALYRACPQAVHWMQVVKPRTVVEWHRRSFLFYWRCRRDRNHLPWKVKGQLHRLIIRMYSENAGWGLGRIHGELLKLGYNVNRATVARHVAKYFARYPVPPTPGWKIFVRNHMHDAAAIDMFVVITMSFRLLYAMVIMRLDRRTILHVDVTEHPTQEWLADRISEAFAENPKPNYLIRDRDSCYGQKVSQRLSELGICERVIAKQSPWQNIYVERLIGSIRRECLDHVIIKGENHLRTILRAYVRYYNRTRTHSSLEQDCPISRPVQTPVEADKIVSIPEVGGLHHRYERRAA
jgi:transposase InsO family protein